MPRVNPDRRSDQVNIPVTPKFKKRILRLAAAAENKPKPTHYVRLLLEGAVNQAEARLTGVARHEGVQ